MRVTKKDKAADPYTAINIEKIIPLNSFMNDIFAFSLLFYPCQLLISSTFISSEHVSIYEKQYALLLLYKLKGSVWLKESYGTGNIFCF